MKLRKFVLTCLLSLMLLPVIGNIIDVEQVKANPDFVTEADDYITIETDYFIANISRIIKRGGGAIKNFYIKPYSNINIVSDENYIALGGHEQCNYYNSTYAKSSSQWTVHSIQSISVEIVYETASVVTVRSIIDFGGYSESTGQSYLEFGLVEYKTFYAEKPYYLVTYSKIYQEDLRQPYNPQTCFLFNIKNFWKRSVDPETSYTLNKTGGIVFGEVSSTAYLSHAKIYGKFPWFWVFNKTLDIGYGIILLDAHPTAGEVLVGLIAGGSSKYTEFQIDHNWGGESDEAPDTVTYLAVVDDTKSYGYINQLATNLYLSSVNPVPITDAYLAVRTNNSTISSHSSFGRTLGGLGRPYTEYITYARNHRWQVIYKNATGSYSLFNWNDLTNQIITYDTSYAAFSYYHDWEDKFHYNYTWQIWNNSDAVKLTVYTKTLQTVNITDLWLSHYSGSGSVWTHEFSEHPDFNKFNHTTAIYQDEGWMLKNLTNQKRTHPNELYTYFWMEDNHADTEYSSGTEWTIKLYIQWFRIYKWQEKNEFLVSDFHEPSEEIVDLSWNVHYWLPAPLFDQKEHLRVLQVKPNSTHIAETTYLSDKLTLICIGDSGRTQTVQVYCADKSKPVSVSGATLWSYDSETKVLTLEVSYSSLTEIVVDWNPAPVPEFPLGFATEISLIIAVAYVWWTSRHKPR